MRSLWEFVLGSSVDKKNEEREFQNNDACLLVVFQGKQDPDLRHATKACSWLQNK